jgi:SAM-dependent methyltransferase
MTHPGFFQGTEMPTAGWWAALWPDPAGVLTKIGMTAGMHVIDLCSGDGWFTSEIARLVRHVNAIDLDRTMLDLARGRLAASGLTNCALIEGNAYDVATLVPGPADVVFMANALHGVPDRLRLTRAVAAALKTGGRFVIVNWHARPRETTTVLGEPRGPASELRMRPETTIAAVVPAGFTLRTVVELPPYHYAGIFEKA